MLGWFRSRKYKSGSRWALWRWTDVDSEYITRLHVFKTPWFAVCLHWLNKPDPEPCLHDHPVTFLSLVLRGGYSELRGAGVPHFVTHNWYNLVRAADRHSIVHVKPGTLILALMGPKTREWGFHLNNGGWLYWKEYYALKRKGVQP